MHGYGSPNWGWPALEIPLTSYLQSPLRLYAVPVTYLTFGSGLYMDMLGIYLDVYSYIYVYTYLQRHIYILHIRWKDYLRLGSSDLGFLGLGLLWA